MKAVCYFAYLFSFFLIVSLRSRDQEILCEVTRSLFSPVDESDWVLGLEKLTEDSERANQKSSLHKLFEIENRSSEQVSMFDYFELGFSVRINKNRTASREKSCSILNKLFRKAIFLSSLELTQSVEEADRLPLRKDCHFDISTQFQRRIEAKRLNEPVLSRDVDNKFRNWKLVDR